MQLQDRPTYEEAFHRKVYTDGKGVCERCATPPVIIKMQIKTAWKTYYTHLSEQLR